MRFLARVSSHVYDEHVLGLEGFLLPRAVRPLTHERLLVRLDMVHVEMLKARDITGDCSAEDEGQFLCSDPVKAKWEGSRHIKPYHVHPCVGQTSALSMPSCQQLPDINNIWTK